MTIIDAADFDAYWKRESAGRAVSAEADAAAAGIIEAVKKEGDAAVKKFAARFDRASPETLEVPHDKARAAWEELCYGEKELAGALKLCAEHLWKFAALQRTQFSDFETEMEPGLFTGQRIISVERAAVYVPAGRFPLISSVLMGLIPAFAAGTGEVLLASPPLEDGLPDRRILAAAALAAQTTASTAKTVGNPRLRIFAMGGAQAIAALALGTETVPRAAVIAGPGNKYVSAAKRLLSGETGIDFVAGPTDVLIITDEDGGTNAPGLVAADMLAQAEHDPDARARAFLPSRKNAEEVQAAIENRLAALPEYSRRTARASLDAGGLLVVYHSKEEAVRAANIIAPEHLELHVEDTAGWEGLHNYGSLFIGRLAAEILGDYSAGINHTLPTSGSARFTGGLSVRHFLKTVTTLRCIPGAGFEQARVAAEIMGRAEGLAAHAESAASRRLMP
jgi:histidinol dehydrogenase